MDIDEQFSNAHLLLETRVCRVCHKEKNLVDEYYLSRKDPTLPSSYSYECKECVVKRTTAYNKNNAYGVRSRYLRRNYGIGLEDYERISADKNHSCDICGKTFASKYNLTEHKTNIHEKRKLFAAAAEKRAMKRF